MKRTKLYLGLVFALALVISEVPLVFDLFRIPQEKVIDRLFLKKDITDEIVVVAIDEESLAEIGQWPWPRETFAQVLPRLASARAIGIDINFSEVSRAGVGDDATFADALASTPHLVVLPVELDSRDSVIAEPLQEFQRGSVLGFVNFPKDGDGSVRRSKSEVGGPGSALPSFSKAVVTVATPAGEITPTVPTSFRIDYRGGDDRFLTIPFSDVSTDAVPTRIFDDKIVLVGVTAESFHDTVETPFGSISGVVAHASAIDTILNGAFFRKIPTWLSAIIVLFIVGSVYLLIHRVRKMLPLVLFLAGILIVIVGVTSLLFNLHIILPVLHFLIAFFASVFLSVTFEYILESREKRFIKQSFQYYISSDLIEELVRHPEKLVLGGEKRRVTILFSDVRGFTTISESMTPEALTSFMSEYFTGISDIVMEKRGVIDKYIGDAIMAFWGAPLQNENHAVDACRAALAIASKLSKDNEVWRAKGLPPIHMGVGINTGDVVVGNMGSRTRFNYTVVGDDVNFTSRIEGLNKEYGTDCIISESTRDAIAGEHDMFARELDEVIVKGKRKPKKLFELVQAPLSGAYSDMLAFFAKGHEYYARGEWDKAVASFNEGLGKCDDAPSKVFIERCKKFKQNPPQDWIGVYEFTSK